MEKQHNVPENVTVGQKTAQQNAQEIENEESGSVQIEVEDEEFLKKRQDEMEKTFKDIVQQLRAELDDAREKQQAEIAQLRQQNTVLNTQLAQAQKEIFDLKDRQCEEIAQLKRQLGESQKQTAAVQEQLKTRQAQPKDAQPRIVNLERNAADFGGKKKVFQQAYQQKAADQKKAQIPNDPNYLVVPDGTEVICKQCYRKKAIERVFIPKDVREIQDSAFEDCKNLREVIFEEGSALKTIGERAFQSCSRLKNINLPEGLEKIGAGCFSSSGLEEIVIPSGVTELGDCAFSCCESLKKVAFQDGSQLPKIDSWCFYNSGLEEFVSPPSLKQIEGGAFYNCKSLKRVVLNEGLETLNSNAYYGTFQDSGLEEITLPSTLKTIGCCTFLGCSSLRTIYVKSGCRANLSWLDLPSSVEIIRQ